MLLDRLKNPERRRIGVVVKHVGTGGDECQRGLPARPPHRRSCSNRSAGFEPSGSPPGPRSPTPDMPPRSGELNPPDEPEDVGPGETTRHHAGEIACLLEPENKGRDVPLDPSPRGNYEDRPGVFSSRLAPRDPGTRSHGQRPGRTLGPRRCVAPRSALPASAPRCGSRKTERVADPQQPLIRSGIPGGIGDRARSDQPDADSGCGLGACYKRHQEDSVAPCRRNCVLKWYVCGKLHRLERESSCQSFIFHTLRRIFNDCGNP